MKTLLLILMMSLPGFSQVVEKRTGEIIYLTVKNADPADSFSIYRRAKATATPILIGAISAVPSVWTYTWTTTMPAGSNKDREYLFWVALKKSGVTQGESNVVTVKRIR